MSERWINFESFTLDSPKFHSWHIDTRSFEVLAVPNKAIIRYSEAMLKNPDLFFFSAQELSAALAKLYAESGGEVKWRCLYFSHAGADKVNANWGLKYLKIFRTADGFVVFNANNYAISKNHLLNFSIKKNLLNAH